MVKLEEVEEEVNKAPAADLPTTTKGAVKSGGGEEEEESEEHDGFETASEGRGGGGSDGDEEVDSFSEDEEKFGRMGVKDDEGGDPGEAVRRSSSVPVAECGEKRTLREEGEEGGGGEKVLTEEQKKKKRQEGIDEAMRAKVEGNSYFAQGQYEEAVAAYHRGLTACLPVLLPPPKNGEQAEGDEVVEEDADVKEIREIRAVLHSNRAACFSHRQMHKDAVEESTKALELNPNYVKALMRRSQAREKLELYEEAIADLKRVLELDPRNTSATASLTTLVPLAEEKREKLKNEMLAKLKEAGNSILGRFGMSVDNFKTVQDPSTGSYSIQFQR